MTFFAKLFGVLLLIGCVIWLALFVVIPLAVMNSATVLAILAFWKPARRTLFASLSLVGAGYLFVDVSAGWLSAMFSTAMQSSAVVTGIVLLNSVAAAASTWFLVQPLWTEGQALKESDPNAGLARMGGAGSLVVLSLVAIPISYKFIAKDFTVPPRTAASGSASSTTPRQGSVTNSTARSEGTATTTCASGGTAEFLGGNLRSDPRHSVDAQNIIAIVDPGASLTILDVTQGEARRATGNTAWFRVKLGSGTCSFDKRSASAGYSCAVENLAEGYVNADLVAGCGSPPVSQPSPTNASGTGKLLTNVNLRACPDKACASLGEHFRNASFELVESVEKDGINWYKIRITQPGCHALNPSWCGKKLLRSKQLGEVNRSHYLDGDDNAADTGWINSYNRELNVYTVRLD